MKTIYVAEAPSSLGHPWSPRTGFPMAGVSQSKGARRFRELAGRSAVVVNLFDHVLPKAGKGSSFPMKKARALALHLDLHQADRVVFVGKRVASAFLGGGIAYFVWFWSGVAMRPAVVVPHPSPANRWWNSEANVRRAKEFWKQLE